MKLNTLLEIFESRRLIILYTEIILTINVINIYTTKCVCVCVLEIYIQLLKSNYKYTVLMSYISYIVFYYCFLYYYTITFFCICTSNTSHYN